MVFSQLHHYVSPTRIDWENLLSRKILYKKKLLDFINHISYTDECVMLRTYRRQTWYLPSIMDAICCFIDNSSKWMSINAN